LADRRLEVAGLAAVLVHGSTVWILRAPDSPLAVRLARVPLLGPAVEALQEQGRRAGSGDPEPRPPPDGRTIRIEIPAPPLPPLVRVPEGATPSPEAAVANGAGPVPPDRSPEPVGPLPPRAADPDRVARALELAGGGARQTTLGPYRFLGDFDPPPRWSGIAAALDAAFAERTGRSPRGTPAETVVALCDRRAYDELTRLEPRLAGVDAGGHAVAGLAALGVDLEHPDRSEAILVHELVHWVERRALGPALPPWLEEGLAEDLAQAPWDPDRGAFRTDRLRGTVRREGLRIEISGARAGLDLLVAALGRGEMPTLAELVAMDWESFVGGSRGAERYAQALQLVRFLLDGGDARRAAGFRAYLATIAAGGGFDRAALEAAWGEPLDRLEAPYRVWLMRRKLVDVDAAIDALAAPGERIGPRQPPSSGSSSRQAEEPSA